jgi:hypothetical protein
LAGFYDEEMDDDDDETRELLMQAEKIKEKEDLRRMEFRLKKNSHQPKMPRRIARKRERTIGRLEDELGELGVDIRQKRMKNFEKEQEREQTGKKIRVGRSRSISAAPTIPRDELGIPDKKVIKQKFNVAKYSCLRPESKHRRSVARARSNSRWTHERAKQTVISTVSNPSICSQESDPLERPIAVNSMHNLLFCCFTNILYRGNRLLIKLLVIIFTSVHLFRIRLLFIFFFLITLI